MGRPLDFTKDWRERYQSRLLSVEEAAKLVKSGDVVDIPLSPLGELNILSEGLVARMAEVKDVRIRVYCSTVGTAIYEPAFAETFKDSYLVLDEFVSPVTRPLMHARRSDFTPTLFHLRYKGLEQGRTTPEDGLPGRRADIVLVKVGPPDKNGFCSFGSSLWYKRNAIKWGKTVIAEVDTSGVRNYQTVRVVGDGYVHISEIDYFVEHPLSGIPQAPVVPTEREMAAISRAAQYLSSLIKDGDCLQVGTGGFTVPLLAAGAFDGKEDLGWHSEITPPDTIRLIKQGVITGKRKAIDIGKAVTTTLPAGSPPEEVAFIENNPAFELRPVEYVNNPRVIAQNDNMVAINSAIMIDLSGQISTESIGPAQWSATGGSFEFALGALMSKGGRSITACPSTTADGQHSHIVGTLLPGTIVTVPRVLADTVITEWGIARLWHKSCRERAKELIAVAHPDFRAELKKEAEKLFYP